MKLALFVIIVFLPLFCLFVKRQPSLNKDKTFSIRGIMAILVILGHCCFYISGNQLNLEIFRGSGVWVCGIFFLLSGYGLWLQNNKIKNMPLSTFIESRVYKILIDFLVIACLYIVLQLFTNKLDIQIIRAIAYGSTDSFLPYSWFIIILICNYFILFFALKLKYPITFILCSTLLLVSILILLPWGSHWYTSMGAFPLGIILAKQKERISKLTIVSMSFIVIGLIVISMYYVNSIYISIITPPHFCCNSLFNL